jgi:hypothetical protein
VVCVPRCDCCAINRCYSVKVVSDAADLSLTLTTLAGTADIYVVELNKSSGDQSDTPKLPSPADPTSYNYTTHGQAGMLPCLCSLKQHILCFTM